MGGLFLDDLIFLDYFPRTMQLLTSYRLYFTLLGGILFFIWPALQQTEEIRYSKAPTIPFDWDNLQTDTISFQDSLSDNVLYQLNIPESIPLFYAQNVRTEVCFDRECRLLNITVYWNITGRYLGFELPIGEFLSKHDHEPFSNDEYARLNDLLADPNLPLGGISFEKLIEIPETVADSIDGISGATTEDVSKMVVKGAAYTTYTLWNVVHGPTQEYVAHLTEKQLSPDLMDLILKSPDINDRVWALNRLSQNTILNPKLTVALLGIISGDDFYLAYSAINAIKAPHLHADTLQIALFSIYKEADHSIKSMIVDKLTEAPYLSPELITASRKLLNKLNGKQLGDLLKLYTKHSINDLKTCKAVAEILKNENRFISRQAYNFLKKSNISDRKISALLYNYEQRE